MANEMDKMSFIQLDILNANFTGTKNRSLFSYAAEVWDLSSQLQVLLSLDLEGTDRSKPMIIRKCALPMIIALKLISIKLLTARKIHKFSNISKLTQRLFFNKKHYLATTFYLITFRLHL